MPMKRMNIMVEEEQIQAWKIAAHDARMNLSEWVRASLDQAAKSQQDPLATVYGEKA
jgi:hypothetical protein